MGRPTGNTRVVQIHATRRCNLQCRHCYSSSSPRASEALTPGVLRTALDELVAQGYNWASFSGGEPLAYPALADVMRHAKTIGMHTAVVSNGMLLTPQRLDAIEAVTDILVLSLDGKPASHNRMRGTPKAFDSMAARLPELRERGMAFGFLFTLTQHNLDELPWVVEFAVNVGAKMLQIHPLDCVGNAARYLRGTEPDGIEGAYAWYLAEQTKRSLAGRLALQVDLVRSDALRQQPQSFFLNEDEDVLDQPLAEQLSPLVIEPDGSVVPLQYGFARSFALGNLHQATLPEMAMRWRVDVGPRLQAVSRELFRVLDDQPSQFIDWYALMAAQARSHTLPDVQRVLAARGRPSHLSA
ncbi:MAG: radical SAM protein [Gammaproteobacteria bacterium]|nr:radical SAM protein [Gammaproteobacteria bacterium]